MIWATLRAGRMVARSGRAGQPAPREWGWVGKLVFAVIVIGVAAQWWRPVLIFGGTFAVLSLLAAWGAASAKREERGPDPLDAAMAGLLGEGSDR
jgi:hypothetical protein